MKLGAYTGARPEIWDRNPQAEILQLNAGALAPHALTSRGSLAPAGSYPARLFHIYISVTRITAAAPVGLCQAYVEMLCQGFFVRRLATVEMIKNNVGDQIVVAIPTDIVLQVGDTLTLYTSDASTGGTVSYDIHVPYTTYEI